MTPLDPSPFLRRLNDYCTRALTNAASLCETRAHCELGIEHWMIKLLEPGDGDLPAIARRHELDMDVIWNGLLTTIERNPRSLRGKPGLSAQLRELLQAAWVRASLEDTSGKIRSAHLLAALVEAPHLLRAPDVWPLLSVSARQIEHMMPELERISVEAEPALASSTAAHAAPGPKTATPESASKATVPVAPGQNDATVLQRFTVDVTQRAREGKIDPVFGREQEIGQIVDILARRRKNNPILVGDPGVGKTALVEGLALRIIAGEVPALLKDVRLLNLDLGLLQAGAGVKGEFEQRLKNVIEAVQQSSTPVLLFIDEAHVLVGASNSSGAGDAANLLKPVLARGELRTIAATTWSEYKQYFERDAALERRFQMVKVDEPDDETACLMLRGLKERYASHHDVHITDAAVGAAVRLSRRYIVGRQLPDKAVDLLDTAAARVKISNETTPAAIVSLEARGAALQREHSALMADRATTSSDHTEAIMSIEFRRQALDDEMAAMHLRYSEQKKAAQRLAVLRREWKKTADVPTQADIESSVRAAHAAFAQIRDPLVHAEVGPELIAQVIADWTGIPAGSLLADELTNLLGLEHALGRVVCGQDEALEALGKRLRAAKAGLCSEDAPLGVFLLVGPSGVGKTETARALAGQMFGGERALITINLSEYQEPHTVSQLKGAPPGYVGYGQGGILTEAVRQRPYSVILLDEVEKAHRDVLNLFYQVFDRGFMRDGEGRVIDFRNTVILMTSNIGSEEIMAADEAHARQQKTSDQHDVIPGSALLEVIRPLLLEHFQTALLARFQTIVYRPLSPAAMTRIVDMKLAKVAQRLEKKYSASLQCDPSLVTALVQAWQLSDSGARNIDSLLDQQIMPVLSRELLQRLAQSETQGKLSKIRLSCSCDGIAEVHFDDIVNAEEVTS